MGVTKESNFVFKFAAGSAAGAIGSIAGNPFDVLKTRMMASADKASPKLVATATALYKQQGNFLSIFLIIFKIIFILIIMITIIIINNINS